MAAARGTLPYVIIVLRIILGILIAVVAAVAAVPVLVVFDLVSGGTAFGMCPAGLRTCQPGYFAGIELLAVLLLVLFIAIGGIALCAKGIRRLQDPIGV
jgi:hypothetical protein